MKGEKKKENSASAFYYFAFYPCVAIAIVFCCKILSLKRFTFGDDCQQLAWFHSGRIAYPFMELLRARVALGRFYPLHYQNFNLVSLMSSDLSVHNLAERCFYVQAGTWVLACVFFFALMRCFAREKTNAIPVSLYCFIPLSLLAFLFTPAMLSYFLMLVFPETLLCVFLPAFLLFYHVGYMKDNAIFLFGAWLLATASLYCKENTFVVFLTICGVWFLFGRKLLSRKHKTFLICLFASVVVFLSLYYFVAYRHAVSAYNQDRLWGVAFTIHLMRIFKSYPIYVPAFLFGGFRLARVLFAHDRRHLFVDAVLFSALCLFLSFLALKLVDWWYWGTGTIFLFPVMFYWLVNYKNIFVYASGFLIVAVCLVLNGVNGKSRIAEIDYAQQKDMAFVKQIDQNAACRRIRFCSFEGKSFLDECYYNYLQQFMMYLGTRGRWQDNVLFATEIPEIPSKDEIYVIWKGIAVPDDFLMKMEQNQFRCAGECSFFKMFAHCPPSPLALPATLAPNSSQCHISGCSEFEENPGGQWLCGKRSELVFNVAGMDYKRGVDFSLEGFTFLFEDFKENVVACSVNDVAMTNLVFRQDVSCLKFHFPAGTLSNGMNHICLAFRKSKSPSGLDPRFLTFFIKTIKMEYANP